MIVLLAVMKNTKHPYPRWNPNPETTKPKLLATNLSSHVTTESPLRH